jgi:hypothetical protein
MDREGRRSHAGDDRRAVKARNAERERLREEHRRVERLLREEEAQRQRSRQRNFEETYQRRPEIRLAEAPPWQVQREQLLSEVYEREVRGSRLARYWRIARIRQGLVFENARGRFEDRGARMVARTGNDLEIRGMLDLAELKVWRELVFTGTEQFKREGMAAALDRGFTVRADGRDVELLRDAERARERHFARERVTVRYRDEGWSR